MLEEHGCDQAPRPHWRLQTSAYRNVLDSAMMTEVRRREGALLISNTAISIPVQILQRHMLRVHCHHIVISISDSLPCYIDECLRHSSSYFPAIQPNLLSLTLAATPRTTSTLATTTAHSWIFITFTLYVV